MRLKALMKSKPRIYWVLLRNEFQGLYNRVKKSEQFEPDGIFLFFSFFFLSKRYPSFLCNNSFIKIDVIFHLKISIIYNYSIDSFDNVVCFNL